MNAETIKNKIDAFVQSEIKVYPVNNLRASNVGHPCERYLYLLIKHWDEVKPHDEGLQNVFDLGNTIEEYTIKKLKDAGLEVITPHERSWRFDVRGGIISGREDIRIKDDETGELFPAEIKGLSPYEWERLNSIDDFYSSKRYYVRGYPAQLMIYCFHFGKEKGYFILTNKLTGEIKPIEVPFDYDKAEALLSKAERIYAAIADESKATELNPCDDISVCEQCPLAHLCTSGIQRTAAEIDDGELEAMIDRQAELAPAYREYNELNDEIKELVAAKIPDEKGSIITGKYYVEVKTIEKKEFTVAARKERRITKRRL
jgi:CRISPR/Cas system-associated exonuclease Cas4 (RecB family)